MSSCHVASSVGSSMYDYDESSEDNSTFYGEDVDVQGNSTQYRMPSMRSLPTVAPGRDQSRLPPPAEGDESTVSSAALARSSSESDDDDGTMTTTTTTSAPLVGIPGQVKTRTATDTAGVKSGTSLEFTVRHPYPTSKKLRGNEQNHGSTDTFPTSNVDSARRSGEKDGNAERSSHRRHRSKVEPRGIEPAPFIAYDEDVVCDGFSSTRGGNIDPPPDPNLKPGEGLKPYLPYDSSSDEESPADGEDEMHAVPNDDGDDDGALCKEDENAESNDWAVAMVVKSQKGHEKDCKKTETKTLPAGGDDDEDKKSSKLDGQRTLALVAAPGTAAQMASVGVTSKPAATNSGITSEHGGSTTRNDLNNIIVVGGNIEGHEKSADNAAVGTLALASAVAAHNARGESSNDEIVTAEEALTDPNEVKMKDVTAVAAVACCCSSVGMSPDIEEAPEDVTPREAVKSINTQADRQQSKSPVLKEEPESIHSPGEEVQLDDVHEDQQGLVPDSNDIEQGTVQGAMSTPVEEIAVTQKMALDDKNDEFNRTSPAVWLARAILVASVITIIVISAIYIPLEQDQLRIPTLAPSSSIPTNPPSPVTLPPSSGSTPLPSMSPTTEGQEPDTSSPTLEQTARPVPLPPSSGSLPEPSLLPTSSPTVELTNDFRATALFGGRDGNQFGTIVSLSSNGNFLAALNQNPSEPVQAFSYRDTIGDGENIEVWNALPFLPVTIFAGSSSPVSGADVSTAALPSGNSIIALSSVYGFEVFQLIDNQRNGTVWEAKGPAMQWQSTLSGMEVMVSSTSVTLSDDGSVLAAGFINEERDITVVQIFQFDKNSESWIQQDEIISQSESGTFPLFFSVTISLSGDGTVLALGTSFEETLPVTVEMFEFDGSSWITMGDPVNLDSGPPSLALSHSGHRLALITPLPGAGAIYEFNVMNSSWKIVGEQLMGGSSISMNSAGTRVVVGDATTDLATVYTNTNGDSWIASSVMTGNTGAKFGESVSMSGDGNRIAIGLPGEDQGQQSLGRIVFYE